MFCFATRRAEIFLFIVRHVFGTFRRKLTAFSLVILVVVVVVVFVVVVAFVVVVVVVVVVFVGFVVFVIVL